MYPAHEQRDSRPTASTVVFQFNSLSFLSPTRRLLFFEIFTLISLAPIPGQNEQCPVPICIHQTLQSLPRPSLLLASSSCCRNSAYSEEVDLYKAEGSSWICHAGVWGDAILKTNRGHVSTRMRDPSALRQAPTSRLFFFLPCTLSSFLITKKNWYLL